MSILIKGMEMPTKQILAVINPDGLVEILSSDNILIEEFQATQVPPHGRCIDADALMKILSKVIDINASIEQRNEATDQERRCLWWFEQQIGIAPTIIPAEEDET